MEVYSSCLVIGVRHWVERVESEGNLVGIKEGGWLMEGVNEGVKRDCY